MNNYLLLIFLLIRHPVNFIFELKIGFTKNRKEIKVVLIDM
jgi:hypothetical protein